MILFIPEAAATQVPPYVQVGTDHEGGFIFCFCFEK